MKNELEIRTIYDVVNKIDINFIKGEFVKKCRELNVDSTSINHILSKKQKSVNDRYILPEYKNTIITLIDTETKERFECINYKTLIKWYLKKPYIENDGKYFYELKVGRQNFASIANRLFYLEGNELNENFCPRKTLINNNTVKEVRCKKDFRRDIGRRLNANLRHCIKHQIKKRKELSNKKTFTGCSIDQLIIYLERKFLPGMTWENYGVKGWVIDHIKPVRLFDLTKEEEQYNCFHYSNLQPLWVEDNNKKQGIYPYIIEFKREINYDI